MYSNCFPRLFGECFPRLFGEAGFFENSNFLKKVKPVAKNSLQLVLLLIKDNFDWKISKAEDNIHKSTSTI